MELVARRDWRGWAVGLCNQAFWLFLIIDRGLWTNRQAILDSSTKGIPNPVIVASACKGVAESGDTANRRFQAVRIGSQIGAAARTRHGPADVSAGGNDQAERRSPKKGGEPLNHQGLYQREPARRPAKEGAVCAGTCPNPRWRATNRLWLRSATQSREGRWISGMTINTGFDSRTLIIAQKPNCEATVDWLTGGMTILAMELVARRDWRGWAVGLANQAFWLWLICSRELWGLLPLTAILSWRYAAALIRWRDIDRVK